MAPAVHRCKLDELCRVCGCKLHKVSTKPAAKKRYPCMYQCAAFSEELLSAFHIATTKDCYQIHPPMFCNKCYRDIELKGKGGVKKEGNKGSMNT